MHCISCVLPKIKKNKDTCIANSLSLSPEMEIISDYQWDRVKHSNVHIGTHKLLFIGSMWWDCLSQNVKCHSLPQVGPRKRCDETALHKMCLVTHSLLVIAKDAMRPWLPFKKCAMSLTTCWSWEKMWWDCLLQNVQCHPPPVDHEKRCDETAFHKMYNVTHILLVIVTWLPFTKCAMSLTDCWS